MTNRKDKPLYCMLTPGLKTRGRNLFRGSLQFLEMETSWKKPMPCYNGMLRCSLQQKMLSHDTHSKTKIIVLSREGRQTKEKMEFSENFHGAPAVF